jgi:hypothetical protein
VTAEYAHGILTIRLGLKGERQEAVTRIQVTTSGT